MINSKTTPKTNANGRTRWVHAHYHTKQSIAKTPLENLLGLEKEFQNVTYKAKGNPMGNS
jgi:hypothetical protein